MSGRNFRYRLGELSGEIADEQIVVDTSDSA
jgi:hypothetical protein